MLSSRASSDADNATIQPALPQSAGYLVVVVIGLVIAFGLLPDGTIRDSLD